MKRFLCVLGLAAVLGGCGDSGEKYVRSVLMEAEQGDAEAQYQLGEWFLLGEGFAQDFEEAFKWYRKAAEQGSMAGQESLGICYMFGTGVTKDLEESIKWLRKADEQGSENTERLIGIAKMLSEGDLLMEQVKQQGLID